MPFFCSICGEESTRICVRCTKDACGNHLCEKCLRCSDCCECQLALDEVVHGAPLGSARAALSLAAVVPDLSAEPVPEPDPEPQEPGPGPDPEPLPEDEPEPGPVAP